MSFEITINGKTEIFETAQEMAEYVDRVRPIQPMRKNVVKPKKKTETSLNKFIQKRVSSNGNNKV